MRPGREALRDLAAQGFIETVLIVAAHVKVNKFEQWPFGPIENETQPVGAGAQPVVAGQLEEKSISQILLSEQYWGYEVAGSLGQGFGRRVNFAEPSELAGVFNC